MDEGTKLVDWTQTSQTRTPGQRPLLQPEVETGTDLRRSEGSMLRVHCGTWCDLDLLRHAVNAKG